MLNFFLLHTLTVENKEDVVSGVWTDKTVKLLFVAHLVLQVHLGPTGEQKWYNISMTSDTGTHEGSQAILRNTMRQNSTITVLNMEKTIGRWILTMKYELHETVNYTNVDIVYTYFTQSCSAEFLKTHTIYYKNCVVVYILSWSTI